MTASAANRHRPAPRRLGHRITSPLRHRLRQAGSFAVETALAMPLLLGVGLVGADMHRIDIERSQMENAAGSASITLAAQTELTRDGLLAVSDVLMLGRPGNYQMVILNVMQSGRVNWGLLRGSGGDLCPSMSDGQNYTGHLPEDPPVKIAGTAAGSDNSTLSYLVVAVCRGTSDIATSGGVVLPATLQVVAVNRAVPLRVKLEATLLAESQSTGLAAVEK